ncbi:PC-esterase domain-containing protein 1B-like isoform X2 [Zootermopsis nevadensis]|uniref:PC-esterase domain-containing protein 1B-like isoform X2 n=1 Tax=Zootermopsis nevadensis TaxID=136037 RepID=UPI000B8E870E|nr:PC-esterase domain-containing protein 1B-like isoform X2 [Zootermopsis nevadensis]
MSDIYLKKDALNLLEKRHAVFFGDSNMRSVYKDLVWLMNKNSLIERNVLKRKLGNSFMGDTLVKSSELHKGRDFEEVRKYEKDNVCMEYFFITRCYNNNIEDMMSAIKKKGRSAPDVIIMNSCLWDITRWGPNGVTAYKDNMVKLMKLLKTSLPPETLVIWTTAPPISTSCSGSLLIKQVEFLQHTLRFEVMEANVFARQIVVSYGFDVLDIHHHLRMQIHRRADDGIHWLPLSVRHMTNLLLTHIVSESVLNKENVLSGTHDLGVAYNNYGEIVDQWRPDVTYNKYGEIVDQWRPDVTYNKYGEIVEPWRPVVMYGNYGEPVYMKQPFYHKLKRCWRQSLFHRQERKFSPYHF